MKKVLTILLMVLMIAQTLPMYPTAVGASAGLQASDYINQHLMIPDSYPEYLSTPSSVYPNKRGRLTKFYLDDTDDKINGSTFIYGFAEGGYDRDNGYLLIPASDLDGWIRYFGNTTNEAFVAKIRDVVKDKFVTLRSEAFEEFDFYSYAEVAEAAGGGSGQINRTVLTRDGQGRPLTYRQGISQHRKYNSVHQHAISMQLPPSELAGEEVSIQLSATEGSIFLKNQQSWNLTITDQDGAAVKKLSNYRIMPRVSDRFAEHTVKHVFPRAGTYTLKFEIEGTSHHSDERTGTSNYSVTKQIVIHPGAWEVDLIVNPSTIQYRDTFVLEPKIIRKPNNLNIQHIDYTIYSPDRSLVKRIRSLNTDPVSIPFAQYPVFFNSVRNQTHPIEMVVVDTNGNRTPVVTKELNVVVTPIRADFEILPNPIMNFRDSFTFRPTLIDTGSQTYSHHQFRIQRAGNTSVSASQHGRTQELTYNYSNYPYAVGVGTHNVEIRVFTQEGNDSGWIASKSLTLLQPGNNSPPQFQIGWVRPWDTKTPVYQAVEGERLHLIYIDDPSVPTPFDPDGDPMEFLGFDFSQSSIWARSLPSKYPIYDDGFHNVMMDTVGYHSARASMRDIWGATTTAFTSIEVIPPNPIPVASCPKEVKHLREVSPQLFDSSRSYSPVGRLIDHSRDEWKNKQTVYINESDGNITVQVELHVYDSIGLKSIDPAVCQITVLPDLPPIAALDVPPLAIRNQLSEIFNVSYSPDGDSLASAEYRYKYDAANDGFENDNWIMIPGTLVKTQLTPTRVGQYVFDVKVCEDYGKCAWASETQPEERRIMDVINLAPTVSFEIEGENLQPNPDHTTTYNAHTILEQWDLLQVNQAQQLPEKAYRWAAAGNELYGGLGKKKENYHRGFFSNQHYTRLWTEPFVDGGFGANDLNPYRAMKSKETGQPILVPADPYAGEWVWRYVPHLYEFMTTRSHFYFSTHVSNHHSFYALNKDLIGPYNYEVTQNGYKHNLENGSYYDYMIIGDSRSVTRKHRLISQPDYQNYSTKHTFVPESDTRGDYLYYQKTTGYYVAGNTVYQGNEWNCNSCRYSFSDYAWESGTVYEIRTYDLLTGEYIGSSFDHNHHGVYMGYQKGIYMWHVQLYEKEGNMVAHSMRYGPNDVRFEDLTEYDRTGKATTWTFNELVPYSKTVDGYELKCSASPLEFRQGMDGEYYRYEPVFCSPVDNGVVIMDVNEMYVAKYNPDFTLAWRTKLRGIDIDKRRSIHWGLANGLETAPSIFMNPFKDEIIVRSYAYNRNTWDSDEYIEILNTKTGAKKAVNPNLKFNASASQFYLDWNGNYQLLNSPMSGSLQADGIISRPGSNTTMLSFRPDGTPYFSFETGGWLESNMFSATIASDHVYGEYIGDGIYLSLHNSHSGGYLNYTSIPWLTKGIPSDEPIIGQGYTLGQLLSNFNVKDHEITFSWSMDDVHGDQDLMGMTFRARDNRNRYALETGGKVLYLAKYVNGQRSVLQQSNFPFQSNRKEQFKIKLIGDQIEVFVNQVPYFSVTDGSFKEGKAGPFSNKSFVRFGDITFKEVSAPNVEWLSNYAIWEEGTAKATVKYLNIKFEDPEKDPRAGSYEWTYEHTPRFLNHQGVSELNGKTFSSERLAFDKVGDYVVTLKAKDDPHPSYRHPSMVFDAYRRTSNPFQNIITVHRRPVAVFTLGINPDKTVRWNDTSYDPDRWLSATNYSTEDTGLDYRTTRGITERKYYYVTPNGVKVNEKLVTPTEAGMYTVGLSVKDEYGAWSYWAEQQIQIITPVPPDEPPHAGFRASKYTAYRGETITITSEAWDKEDGPSRNLRHEYYAQNVNGGPEYFQGDHRESWPKVFATLGTFNFRQVVYDSKGQSDQAIRPISIINRKPMTQVTTPVATSSANPTIMKESQPIIHWSYSDGDQDPQQKFKVSIRNAANGTIVQQSGEMTSNARQWKVALPLAENIVYAVEAQVFDGYDWSNVSSQKFMKIVLNSPPIAQFDWTPKPVWEGDQVTLINQSTDPDGDPLTYQWIIKRPDGSILEDHAMHPVRKFDLVGLYSVQLTVSDLKATSTITKTIQALPLTLEPDVLHTPQWLEHHLAKGHQVTDHPKDFYAGEKLLLTARVSPTAVTAVDAKLVAVGLDGQELRTETKLIHNEAGHYSGELYDERWISLQSGLPKGRWEIQFKVKYANGVEKTSFVPIQIIGNALSTSGVHRRR